MAYPRYIGKSAFASGTGALTVAALTGTQAGDIIVLVCESANQVISPPVGYVDAAAQIGTGTAGAAGAVRIAVFSRVLGEESDTATTVADSGDHTTAIKFLFRDTTLVGQFNASARYSQAATTAMVFPAVTSLIDESMILLAVAQDTDAASTATVGAVTNANLTSITERHDQTVATNTGGGVALITGLKATAGNTGTSTATGSTSVTHAYITLALSPVVNQQSTNAFNSLPDAVYRPLSDAMRIVADSSGQVNVSASLTFGAVDASGSRTYTCNTMWYYRQYGTDSWSATSAASAVQACQVEFGLVTQDGIVLDERSITGLTNAVEYEFVLFGARDSATPANDLSFTGTASIALPAASYTIASDGASYALTGQATNLEFGRLVASNGMSYALSGQTANLLRGYRLVADGASYSLAGQTANLTYASISNYSMTADAGSFALSGQSAGLLFGREVISDGISYSLTGQSAGLVAGRRLVSDGSAYILTRQDASFIRTYRLVAEPASFSLSGADMGFNYQHRLAADNGTFSLVGQEAILAFETVGAFTLGCLGASYSLSGASANLAVGRRLVADGTAYSRTGQPAGLLLGRRLMADSGAFSLAGQPAAAVYARRMVSAGASFGLTGQDAGLRFGRRVAADGGSVAMTGQQASLRYSRILSLSGAAYSLSGGALDFAKGIIIQCEQASFALAGGDLSFVLRVAIRKVLAGDQPLTAIFRNGFGIRKAYVGDSVVWELPEPAGAMDAQGAVYSLSGFAITLRHGYHVAAHSSEIGLAGGECLMKLGRVVQMGSGSFSMTGGAATMTKSGSIVNPLSGGSVRSSTAYSESDAEAWMTFNANGSISAGATPDSAINTINGQRWFTSEPDQTYEIFATQISTSGVGSTAGTMGAWVTPPHSWGVYKAGGANGSKNRAIRFQIRRQSDQVVVSNGTNDYTLTCTTSVGEPP